MPDKFNKISRELRRMIALSANRDLDDEPDDDDYDYDILIDELDDELDDDYNEYDDDYDDFDILIDGLDDEPDDELDDEDDYNEYDDDYDDYDDHSLIDLSKRISYFDDHFSDLDDDELTREIQELLDKINESKYDVPSNSAMRDFYSDDETAKLFKQNGWPNTANREFYRAKNKVDKLLRNRQCQFDNSKGLSGAFLIPVADYDDIINSSNKIVKDVIQDFEDGRVYVNKKSKKWDTSKQLRTGGK